MRAKYRPSKNKKNEHGTMGLYIPINMDAANIITDIMISNMSLTILNGIIFMKIKEKGKRKNR